MTSVVLTHQEVTTAYANMDTLKITVHVKVNVRLLPRLLWRLIFLSFAKDIDECVSTPDPCGPRKTCVNKNGSYACHCRPGYMLLKNNNCEGMSVVRTCLHCDIYSTFIFSCVDIDECNNYYSMHDCKRMQTCVNTHGGYQCQCSMGYEIGSSGECEGQ